MGNCASCDKTDCEGTYEAIDSIPLSVSESRPLDSFLRVHLFLTVDKPAVRNGLPATVGRPDDRRIESAISLAAAFPEEKDVAESLFSPGGEPVPVEVWRLHDLGDGRQATQVEVSLGS